MNRPQAPMKGILYGISFTKKKILPAFLMLLLLSLTILPAVAQSPLLPPNQSWLQQNWIYLLFAFIVMALIYGIRMYEISRIKLKIVINQGKLETVKSKELDKRKTQFFTDISHEFRTPLTLIMGRLEQLIEGNTDAEVQQDYSQIYSNASRLLQLINQLLDLSRLESGSHVIRAGKGDFLAFINGLTMSFASEARHRDIDLQTEIESDIDVDSLNASFYYDADIMEKIFNNLLSNAFKFTPDNGEITVKLKLVHHPVSKESMEITIEDSGIGIPEKALSNVFDRFYKNDSPGFPLFEGAGIGLALVKELVSLHNGEIIVKSQEGAGSSFAVRFPIGKEHFSSEQITSDIQAVEFSPDRLQGIPGGSKVQNIFISDPKSVAVSKKRGKEWVLIVEDHMEVSDYIVNCIQAEYNVIQASSALEGFVKAEEYIPDLIISDIMMPGEDGFHFCEKIKTSTKTSHIPVILLTAMADFRDKITGLEAGADDYLTKPFQSKELKLRIRNLIANRLTLRNKYSSNSVIKPAEISVSSCDAAFIGNLLKLVEKNMENQNFSVSDMSADALMSKSQLHRKLKAIVNMSSNQFIRSVRMHRAMELLKTGAGNISEIAYRVGYDDPGYFSKTFRTFFGKLPSEIDSVF